MGMTGGLCKTTLMSESARAKRCRQHVTQTGHYEQQCKTSWKKSLHLPQVTHYYMFYSICEPERLFGPDF